MGQADPRVELDEDLDQMWRRAGRVPLGGAAAVSSGAGAIIGIDWKYNGQPTVLAVVAASMIAIFVSLALATIGLRLRRDTKALAREQQQQRQDLEHLAQQRQENAVLKARIVELEARLAEFERPSSRRREAARSTNRGRLLTPVEIVKPEVPSP